MSEGNLLKALWVKYSELKRWTHASGSTSKKFIIVKDTFEDSSDGTPSDEQNQAAASEEKRKYVTITGSIFPSTEPFVNHSLTIEIQVPYTYPHVPPKVYMRTNIRHPNKEKDGEICITALDKVATWNALPLSSIVEKVIEAIDTPQINYAVDGEMGSLYDSNRQEYNKTIRQMVEKYGERRT